MHVDEFSAKSKAKGAKFWPTCIFDTISKFLDILINELPKHLPPFHDVDHKNEMVLGFAPPFKSPYQLNKKELQELKAQINNLMERGYIKPSKLHYGLLVLFVDENDKKLRMCIDYCTLNKIIINNNYPLPELMIFSIV
jgi:hypothetical protein